jgi:hypothetical protein
MCQSSIETIDDEHLNMKKKVEMRLASFLFVRELLELFPTNVGRLPSRRVCGTKVEQFAVIRFLQVLRPLWGERAWVNVHLRPIVWLVEHIRKGFP